ncbi:MAG: hypothetical protein ACR2N2_04140 [Acidimicrobiia bacterium]
MNSLDTLARSAAEAVHESVSDLPVPVGTVGAAAGAAATWRMLRYAVAGATAGIAVVAVLVLAPSPEDDVPADTTQPPTTAVTTTTPADDQVTTTVVETTPTEPPTETPAAVVGDEPSEEAPPIDVTPPHLVVLSPQNGEHLEASTVTFTGETEAGASVMASGKFPAQVNADGAWSVDLVLAGGANGVVFASTDAAGNVAEVRMTVYYDKPEPKETTTTKAAAWDFTAHQKYGSCEEPVPYDEFSGYAKPGTTVKITSDFGSGSTTADGEGNWWVRVEFPSAPKGQTFKVKAKDAFGTIRTFNFVSNYEG